MAEQDGECDDMKNLRFERYPNSPNQFGIIIPDCMCNGRNAYISEECLLTLLQQLLKVMDDPVMEGIDYSELYDLSGLLQKKCKEKMKANNNKQHLTGLKEFGTNIGSNIRNLKSRKGQTPCEDVISQDAAEGPSEEEIRQRLLQMEERRKQEEREREEERCKARDAWFQAERELAEEKAKYSKAKRIELIYNGKVQPMLQPFRKLMESLIYFAGCLNAEDYSTRKRVLRNRQRMICSSIQANAWDVVLAREAFQGVDEMLAAMAQEAKIPDLPQILDQLTTSMYLQKKQATEELKQKYLLENEKLRLNDIQQRKILEYISLFRELYPVIEKICAACESEIEEQWAISIGQEIVQLVDCYRPRKTNMKFVFVYPDDNTITQSESVKITFVAAEANSPGLFYIDSDSGELVCVIPGRVK